MANVAAGLTFIIKTKKNTNILYQLGEQNNEKQQQQRQRTHKFHIVLSALNLSKNILILGGKRFNTQTIEKRYIIYLLLC